MSEEEEPSYCPFCGDAGDVEEIGKTSQGAYVLRCKACKKDALVEDVTGKVQVTITVNK